MIRHLAGWSVLAALCFIPAVSSADAPQSFTPAVYDTVDAVEVWGNRLIVTGIISGQDHVSELGYQIADRSNVGTIFPEGAIRCDRLALLAIAKPGKYQFATTHLVNFATLLGCKLIVRTP
jgi:hypothetical protein